MLHRSPGIIGRVESAVALSLPALGALGACLGRSTILPTLDKGFEQAILKAFLRAQGIAESAVLEWDREAPDFLATIGDEGVGIEVTMLSEAVPRHATHQLQWRAETRRIVTIAQQIYERTHPEPLVVSLQFRPDWMPKGDRDVVANELVKVVEKALALPWPLAEPGRAITWNIDHAALDYVRVDHLKSPPGLWDAIVAGSVESASLDDVQTTVSRKEGVLAAYRLIAPRQWLLIDCGSLTGQQVAYDVPAPRRVTTGFDRVFCTGFGLWEWVEMETQRPF